MAALSPVPPSVDHQYMQWRFIEWVYAFGPLTPHNIMEYFSYSPYYDKTSTNQTLRMQTEYVTEEGAQGRGEWNDPEKLRMLTGTEFVLVHAAPPTFFIIHKRLRSSPSSTRLLSVYYVLNANIYQSTSLHTLLQSALSNATSHILASLDALDERRPEWNTNEGWRYSLKTEEEEEESSLGLGKDKGKDLPGIGGADGLTGSRDKGRKADVNPILLNALRTTANSYRPQPAPSRPGTTPTHGGRSNLNTTLPNSRLISRVASPAPLSRGSPAPAPAPTSTTSGPGLEKDELVLGTSGRRKPKRAVAAATSGVKK
ncbi:hypothetical protein BT69DRAFT_1286832 [Atractiella rhizophila]|nr:hypothetical protein BT69DRAFT_1286832 [Atractiella rhizophila]